MSSPNQRLWLFRLDMSELARAGESAAELRAAGSEPVHVFAVASDGKRVWVRAAGSAKPTPRGRPKTPPRRRR